MASSRNCPADLVEALSEELRRRFAPGTAIAVALSGGIDSVVLLHALHLASAKYPIALSAHHVCHGISAHSEEWATFCLRLCQSLGVPLSTTRLALSRAPQESIEALAREARHAALRSLNCAVVALAHHADDQAETVLLQLLRGAGVAGLAAMPAFDAGHPAFWRPLLTCTRAQIQAWAEQRGLAWVEDESNKDLRLRRNFLRHEIAPRLAAAFPGHATNLARSARHCAEAAQLLKDLAKLDGLPAAAEEGLPLPALRALPEARAGNLLRQFFRLANLAAPSEARLRALLKAALSARADARTELVHEDIRLVRECDRLIFVPPEPGDFELIWRGEAEIELPHGRLHFASATGEGLPETILADPQCRIRPCPPGARIWLPQQTRSQAVKELLRAAGVPAWVRPSWPAVFLGETLVAVAGLGPAESHRCKAHEPGWMLQWQPTALGQGHVWTSPAPGTIAPKPESHFEPHAKPRHDFNG